MKATVNSAVTAYVGTWYEWTGSGTSYYHFGGRRSAMRVGTNVTYIHADHLSSATNTTGYQTTSQRYYPFGQTRGSNTVATTYRFTGQRWEDTIKLYYYNARWYHAGLGRFISADSIVPEPGNPQSLNRYSYVLNNPLRLIDPSGNWYTESAGPPRDPEPDPWNLTEWLVAEANRDAELPEVQEIFWLNQVGNAGPGTVPFKAQAVFMWIMLVKNQAPFDFKRRIEKDLGKSIKLGNFWFEYSTPGNILFAFLSAAAGFSLEGAHVGASCAQVGDFITGQGPLGPMKAGFDQEQDFAAIEFGYRMYREAYVPDRQLTVQEFTGLLVNYAPLTKSAWGVDPHPKSPPYPYEPGHFYGPNDPSRAFCSLASNKEKAK